MPRRFPEKLSRCGKTGAAVSEYGTPLTRPVATLSPIGGEGVNL